MEVILQSVLFSEDVCTKRDIFYRASGNVKQNGNRLVLKKGAVIRTNTYMNVFDAKTWNRYAPIKILKLKMEVKGEGCVRIYSWSKAGKELIAESEINSSQSVKRTFRFIDVKDMLFFEVTSRGYFEVKNAYYAAEVDDAQLNQVHLSLVICTYHRNEQLMRNIGKLKNSLFFDAQSVLYHHLSIRIVDNASELSEISEEYMKLYHNENTGGSGGFSRGIIESRKDEQEYGITHVICMDDDVEISLEAFYRLYALLCLMRPVYRNEIIGGRMFRLDERNIQYTAAEIWNQGDIIHIGQNQDMSQVDAILKMNEKTGEYTGWWFGCFPMEFVREQLPLPFFLHCDDVEYGLRHGGRPLLLNGIQVWHETYESRQSPIVTYYDTRNRMIVNTLYDWRGGSKEIWETWEKQLNYYYNKKDYRAEYAAILAMWDYLDGSNMFLKKSGKKKITGIHPKMLKYISSVLWRIVFLKYKIIGQKAFVSYEKVLENH